MKIIIFSNVFWPETFLINKFALRMSKNQHQVVAYTGLPNYPEGNFYKNYSFFGGPYNEKFEDVSVIRYPMFPRLKGFVFLFFNYLTNLISALANLFRLPSADVYLVFAVSPILKTIPALVLKIFTGKPVVMWYQDLWPDSFFAVTRLKPTGFFGWFLKLMTKAIYKGCDAILIQSEGFRSELLKAGYKGPIYYVPNWANSIEPHNSKSAWLNSIPSNKKIMTFAGNVGHAQGLEQVLNALVSVPSDSIHFVIVGDGSARLSLEALAQELKLKNILFLGRQPQEDMPALFQKSDFLLVSLKKDYLFSLVIPSKIQSYMQSGKPIIAFLDGEGAQVIQKAQCGVTAEAENSLELSNQLNYLLRCSSDDLLHMGQNGKIFFENNFSEEHVINELEKILQQVIKESQS